MKFSTLSQFIALTIVLGLGLGAIIATAYRTEIERNWDHYRCDPGVVLLGKSFKPSTDPRTPSQFAEDNLNFCQKEYVQAAIRDAAAIPNEMAKAEADTVAALKDVADVAGDIFVDVWTFIYEAYSAFMDQMKTAAKLFQNMLLNMKLMVDRLQASILAIVYGLISLFIAFVNTVRVTVIVIIIVIGILIGLSILIMWFFPPIFILTDLMMALAVAAVAAIGVELAEGFDEPCVCFATGTSVVMQEGSRKPIEQIRVGDVLSGGAEVTATHRFVSADTVFDLKGVHVTGDHLVHTEGTRIPVRDHPDAVPLTSCCRRRQMKQELWCLTTSTRTIPCLTAMNDILTFADWEEIDAEDETSLRAWYVQTWAFLNKSRTSLRRPTQASLNSESAISPDCMVEVQRWTGRIWIRAADVRIGDNMFVSETDTTEVIGIVELDVEEVEAAVSLSSVEHGEQIVSLGTWLLGSSGPEQGTLPAIWAPPIGLPATKKRPASWVQFYTDNGCIRLSGNWILRDASDVGLTNVRRLVDQVVLKSTDKIGLPR